MAGPEDPLSNDVVLTYDKEHDKNFVWVNKAKPAPFTGVLIKEPKFRQMFADIQERDYYKEEFERLNDPFYQNTTAGTGFYLLGAGLVGLLLGLVVGSIVNK